MARLWQDLLNGLRGKRPAKGPERPAPARGSRRGKPRETVVLNIGVDFGTSFTKICFRDVGADQSGIVRLGKGGAAIIPSIVCVAANGRLYRKGRTPPAARLTEIPFLKMRLAGMPIENDDPAIARHNLGSEAAGRALSAWFLATVLSESRACLETAEEQRFRNREIIWTANVGVPVEHCDSPALAVSREVLAVAWEWQRENRIPASVTDCLAAYNDDCAETDPDKSDFHVVPEIAAAVQSFVMSRSAVPGFYVYFDIGGGTVDGVAFHFANVSGTKRVNFYSGSVGPLGMAVLAKPQGGDKRKVQRLVAGVITTARKKDGRDWRLIQEGINRTLLGRLDVSAMAPLVVFLGGYGAANQWYRKSIAATYKEFQHNCAGIPPYELNTVPTPGDLILGPDDDFVRFAIAYGLSVPYGAGPEIALPSQIEGRPGPRPHPGGGPGLRPPPGGGGVDYLDSKDAFD